ncbi:hypothetical protein [Streptomyces sp. NPDC057909]|uniref:hypothetical protein n=1 Tax=Streptomyces sp. NPDC057909 TaxID=3346277 RepID=UPI0036EDF935
MKIESRRIARIGKTRTAALTAGIIIASAGSVAYASIPDSNGTIHACVGKYSGISRIIDGSIKTCDPNVEDSLNWNQAGPPGISGLERVQVLKTAEPETTTFITAQCPAGKKVISGGVSTIFKVTSSEPLANLTGWRVSVINEYSDAGAGDVPVFALCANVN